MIRYHAKSVASISATALALALLAAACGGAPSTETTSESDTQPLAQCSFSVTKNVYTGSDWWGTVTAKNNTGAAVSGVQISFDVPSGVSCDYSESGWTYAQSGRTCTYKKSSGSVAAGASVTVNYSTNSQAFTAATNVKVSAATCGGVTPPPPPPPADGGTSGQWRKANMTNFTSYPDPGSDECINYNGCQWAGQFAALPGKQPESWVRANNIAAVHSRDFAQYKLKTLRLRKDNKQIDVKVYDMCADSDCSGCCTANARGTGFLLDLESYTAARFGTGDGVVEWTCLDCQ